MGAKLDDIPIRIEDIVPGETIHCERAVRDYSAI